MLTADGPCGCPTLLSRVGRSPTVIANARLCQWIALHRVSDRAARMSVAGCPMPVRAPWRAATPSCRGPWSSPWPASRCFSGGEEGRPPLSSCPYLGKTKQINGTNRSALHGRRPEDRKRRVNRTGRTWDRGPRGWQSSPRARVAHHRRRPVAAAVRPTVYPIVASGLNVTIFRH
jgi:hypothetical protein